MEKRVIKFNLVGAICILILTIALIVGLIVGIPKLVDKNKHNSNNESYSNKNEIEEISEEKEYTDTIQRLDGNEQELKMKICKSDLGYIMKYDYNLFLAQKNINLQDRYISLYSNTVGITVEKQNGDFAKIPQILNQSVNESSQNEVQQNNQDISEKFRFNVNEQQIKEFYVVQTDISGKKAYRRTIKTDKTTDYVYCIQINEESYYVVHMYCGNEFTNDLLPVMEYMMNTFKIIEE